MEAGKPIPLVGPGQDVKEMVEEYLNEQEGQVTKGICIDKYLGKMKVCKYAEPRYGCRQEIPRHDTFDVYLALGLAIATRQNH
jgi:hypothetical protein